MTTINPKVVDTYGGNVVASFEAVKSAGYIGVIHKATQFHQDAQYATRRPRALAAGLKWGAYHFCTDGDPKTQAHSFLSVAEPDKDTACYLDWEPYPGAHIPMTVKGALIFLQTVSAAIGRPCGVYGGSVPKELLIHASDADRAEIAKYPLWLSQYGPAPMLLDYNKKPLPWTKYKLWQFTDGNVGPQPHGVPGMGKVVDISSYDGTDEQLIKEWA